MKKYLSLGGGVNSVAMLLLLLDAGEQFEIVFCDTGLELPETYDYIKMIDRDITPVTRIEGRGTANRTLYEHCLHYRNFPTRRWKWCSDKFKIRPMHRFFQKPCIDFVGIGYDERNRNSLKFHHKGIQKRYPLIEQKLGRQDCVRLIKDHGLAVPPKSGCYICPSQSKVQWRRLYRNYPELYRRAKYLEEITNQRLKEQGKQPYYFLGTPLPYLVGEQQLTLLLDPTS